VAASPLSSIKIMLDNLTIYALFTLSFLPKYFVLYYVFEWRLFLLKHF